MRKDTRLLLKLRKDGAFRPVVSATFVHAELAAEGCRVMTCQADVSQREQVEAMVRRVEQTFGAVSLLVNNAGIAGQSLFQELTDERWHEFFSVNVDGAFYASRLCSGHRSSCGHIRRKGRTPCPP